MSPANVFHVLKPIGGVLNFVILFCTNYNTRILNKYKNIYEVKM